MRRHRGPEGPGPGTAGTARGASMAEALEAPGRRLPAPAAVSPGDPAWGLSSWGTVEVNDFLPPR